MPRSAATILGLILVVFSIGFNTARYPVVWELANPARTTETVQPIDVLQPEDSDIAEPIAQHDTPSASSPSSQPIPMQPISENADRVVVNVLRSGRNGSTTDESVDWNTHTTAGIESRKPLVPIASVSPPIALQSMVVGNASIRRLPPVGWACPDAVERVPAWSSSGPIPVYPSTGIE